MASTEHMRRGPYVSTGPIEWVGRHDGEFVFHKDDAGLT